MLPVHFSLSTQIMESFRENGMKKTGDSWTLIGESANTATSMDRALAKTNIFLVGVHWICIHCLIVLVIHHYYLVVQFPMFLWDDFIFKKNHTTFQHLFFCCFLWFSKPGVFRSPLEALRQTSQEESPRRCAGDGEDHPGSQLVYAR